MFHLMLIIIPLAFLVLICSVVLFGLALVIAGLIGGTSAALLAKNKAIRSLLFMGFFVLLLIGALFIIPVVSMFVSLSFNVVYICCILILCLIVILSVCAVAAAKKIKNKAGKTITTVLFEAVGFITAVIAIVAIALKI